MLPEFSFAQIFEIQSKIDSYNCLPTPRRGAHRIFSTTTSYSKIEILEKRTPEITESDKMLVKMVSKLLLSSI